MWSNIQAKEFLEAFEGSVNLDIHVVFEYERERPPPVGHDLHFKTFAAMQTVAAVNRQLALLGSRTAPREFRGLAFLSNAVDRLERTLEY